MFRIPIVKSSTKIIDSFNKVFNHVEQVKKFELIFKRVGGIEGGELTSKMSLKRKSGDGKRTKQLSTKDISLIFRAYLIILPFKHGNMVKSMTGFGRTERVVGDKTFLIDIKSLNGKQFELNLKLPAFIKPFEFEIRNILSKNLNSRIS